jgi:hypothetical protein
MKAVLLAALAFAIACIVAGIILMSRPATPDRALAAAAAARGAAPARTADAAQLAAPAAEAPASAAPATAPAPPSPITHSAPPVEPAKAPARPPSVAAGASQGGRSAKEPLRDPLAREALAFVGADPLAEEYWYAAINDPSLPAQERQDLIEDLNEDGLSDPKHPGPEDLPLILNRIVLIERVAPTAPDQVNAEALQEAYKDLVNLARLAMADGGPVR